MVRKIILAAISIVFGTLAVLWLLGERGRLMTRSSWNWLRAFGWRQVFSFETWHAYIYGRWTKQYIGWSVKYVFPRTKPVEGKHYWADGYHGKILPTALAKAIVTLDHDVPQQDLEQIIPYPTARNILLQGPPEIIAYECGCRQARENPCQPTQVCMVVGQPFVDFALEHNPQSCHRLTQTEALELLQAEHERGHMHAAYFKDAMLNRFYAICNCCKCCCAGIESMVKHGVPMIASSGYVAQVDQDACNFCGVCENACPFDAIQIADSINITWDKCMGCGVCEGQCPTQALSLVRDERKGIPLDVRLL